MMRRLSRRAWLFLALALCLAVVASAAGLVFSSKGGNRAQAAAASGTTAPASPAPQPASAQARADLGRMQAALNSGSVSAQAALLAPPLKFAPGSGPVVPAGKTVTVRPGTFRQDGQAAVVQAGVSDGTTVTLGLRLAQGHWRLYGVQVPAQAAARVTGQPASAQLTAAVSAAQAAQDNGIYQPVILVHGFGESASNWDSSGMTARIRAIPGVRVLKFDYSKANTRWVSDPAIGQKLADDIHHEAEASGRKVIVVGFSMGGLAIRYAATTGGAAGDIAEDITIGTPNTGSFGGNAHDVLCGAGGLVFVMTGHGSFCTQLQAASAMSVLNPEILMLPKLPSTIPLHAIAGNEIYIYRLWGAMGAFPFVGDGAVTPWSALDRHPGSGHDTYETVTNPLVWDDTSAWHLNLTRNPDVQKLVSGYISDWIRDNPLPRELPLLEQPPALGGEAYWLADGGVWYVHDAGLRISRAAATSSEADLFGIETWNAYGTVVTGTAHLRLTPQDDGSLLGTYIDDATYVKTPGADTSPWPGPDSSAPKMGEVVRLVPVAPGHAKSVYGGNSPRMFVGGNTNWCQDSLPDASKYCGA
jgi:pimeloyl-ACP methyl ester carboxylesterase